MRLLYVPDAGLKRVCQRVRSLTYDDISRVVAMFDLIKTTDPKGIGLAAAQVDWDCALFVMNIEQTPQGEWLYVNPEIVWTSQQETAGVEGCLSVPGRDYVVVRPAFVRAKAAVFSGVNLRSILERSPKDIAINPTEFVQEFRLSGIKARCFQHEFDHLQGLTIVDRGKPFKDERRN
jgi:peptide deformylase